MYCHKELSMNPKYQLNRRSENRNDNALIATIATRKTSRMLISHKGKFACYDGKPLFLMLSQVSELKLKSAQTVKQAGFEMLYLGDFENSPDLSTETTHYFCANFQHEPCLDHPILNSVAQWQELRAISQSLSQLEFGQLFYAQGLINWHFSHQFCAKCGARTKLASSGHSRICNNEHCAKEHFPRIEPAVIFSIETVIDGVPKLLLARQENWPDKRYSVLAGFAEHGESLELAVKREAYEEVGLSVNNIQYHSSQPWPFPASLMLGFHCETNEHDICLIDQELEQAHWYSAKEIKTAVESNQLLMPFSISISWQLVDHWYKNQTGEPLKSIKTNPIDKQR
jgi:NAD+ diphosphatase